MWNKQKRGIKGNPRVTDPDCNTPRARTFKP